MAERKPPFAGIPLRAMGDRRLSAELHRVLQVIAAHDRFGKNGQHCHASHARIAELAGCALKSLSRSIKALVDYGYIEIVEHPDGRRHRAYTVIYLLEDVELLKRPTGNNAATYEGAEFGNNEPPIGNNAIFEGKQFQIVTDYQKRSCEALEVYHAEAEKKDPVETASPKGAVRAENRKIAEYLRKLQAALRGTEGRSFTKGEFRYFEYHAAKCAAIEDEVAYSDTDLATRNLGFQAQRLADEIHLKIESGI